MIRDINDASDGGSQAPGDGTSLRVLANYDVAGYRLPEGMREEDRKAFAHEHVPLQHAVHMRRYDDLILLGSGFTLDRQGAVLDTSVNTRTSKGVTPSMRRRVLRERIVTRLFRETHKRAALPTNRSTRGFYHWLIEGLPRIFLLHELGWKDPVLVPAYYEKLRFARESLRLFDELRIEYVPRYREAMIREAFLIDDLSPLGPDIITQNGPVLARMAAYLRDRAGAQDGHADEHLYISRGNARRKFCNEDQLMPVLERHGYRRVVLEEHSFEEQIKILARARKVLAPHGAGIANVIFMPEGGEVIEGRRRASDNVTFFRLCEAMGHRYRYIVGETVASDLDGGNPHNSDIKPDPNELAAMLED